MDITKIRKVNISVRIIDTLNPFSWYKTSKFIIDNNIDCVIFRYWHPFFILSYYGIIKCLEKSNKKIQYCCICDNIYPHERLPFDTYFIKIFFNKIHKFFVMSNKTQEDIEQLSVNKSIKKIFLPINNSFGPIINKNIASISCASRIYYDWIFFMRLYFKSIYIVYFINI